MFTDSPPFPSDATTRERIEISARHLFVNLGVAETSVRGITQLAGITEGALYRHFSSKEELVQALYSNAMDRMQSAIGLQELRPEVSVAVRISEMVAGFCELFDDSPDDFRFVLLTAHTGRTHLEDKRHPLMALQRLIDGAIIAGDLKPQNSIVSASMVLGLVIQVAASRVYERFDTPLTALSSTIASACMSILER